jgi:uncharacterized protein
MPSIVALPAQPGIFVFENTAGPTPPAIATMNRLYMLGSSTIGDALTGVPTVIGSMDEFTNLFGSSNAINLQSIDAYLKNFKRSLYFVKTKPTPQATVTVTTTAAALYTVTIGGNAVSATIPASPTPTAQIVIDALVSAINNNTTANQLVVAELKLDTNGLPVYAPAEFWLRSKDGNLFTLTSTANLTPGAVAAPGTIGYLDWESAIDRLVSVAEEEELGFLCAPEAFYSLTSQFNRTIVGNNLEQAARSLGWYALIDPGNPTLIDHPIKAKTDAAGYTAIRGHSSYCYPYAQNSSAADVAPSVLQAAFALQLYESEGIQQPPAGTAFPFKGVAKLRYTLSKAQQGDLAQSRINTLLYKNGVGFVPGDTLTRSTDPNFRFIHTRVIFNCLERTIYKTLDASGLLHESIGGRNLFYLRLKMTVEGVVARFYEGGALYGITADGAYAVNCDETIQNNADLEAGIVNVDVYAVPAANARQIRNTVYRVQIGNIPQALLTGGV